MITQCSTLTAGMNALLSKSSYLKTACLFSSCASHRFIDWICHCQFARYRTVQFTDIRSKRISCVVQWFSNFLGSVPPFPNWGIQVPPLTTWTPYGCPSGLYTSEYTSFAENSRLTSLQRVALQRVVSLSSCYFLQKSFQQKGYCG